MKYSAEKLIETSIKSSGSPWVNDEVLNKLVIKWKIPRDYFNETLQKSCIEKKVIRYRGYYTLAKYADMEDKIAVNIGRIVYHNSCEHTSKEIDDAISQAQKELKITLHSQQSLSVRNSIMNSLSGITGGPGTGKTSTLLVFFRSLEILEPDREVLFAAPTGKASMRISEQTGQYACTAHKMYKVAADKMSEEDKKELDNVTIIIDEFSMVDMELAVRIFSQTGIHSRIVFVGDINQLPSIGPGAVLRDLLRCKGINSVRLTKTFRQANDSILFGNILKIAAGDYKLQIGDDFHFIAATKENGEKKIMDEYLRYCQKYGTEQTVLLIPFRKSGNICSDKLNKNIQIHYQHCDADTAFCVNDIVMQLENREECVNGEVGRVLDVSSKGIIVKYTECIVEYEPDDYYQISLAYAMSIHKSQGSEYDAVIVAMFDEHECMLTRNILFTGVTRAKKEVTIIGSQRAIKTAIMTDRSDDRKTFLTEKCEYVIETNAKLAYL